MSDDQATEVIRLRHRLRAMAALPRLRRATRGHAGPRALPGALRGLAEPELMFELARWRCTSSSSDLSRPGAVGSAPTAPRSSRPAPGLGARLLRAKLSQTHESSALASDDGDRGLGQRLPGLVPAGSRRRPGRTGWFRHATRGPGSTAGGSRCTAMRRRSPDSSRPPCAGGVATMAPRHPAARRSNRGPECDEFLNRYEDCVRQRFPDAAFRANGGAAPRSLRASWRTQAADPSRPSLAGERLRRDGRRGQEGPGWPRLQLVAFRAERRQPMR